MTLADYLSETFVRNALVAATLVAVTAGLIGPLVNIRDLAFAVHGTAELAFTGAAAGLLAANNPSWGLCWDHSSLRPPSDSWEITHANEIQLSVSSSPSA
jgi:ABC-type Mn2+/Zn2+ transport system permease subunit